MFTYCKRTKSVPVQERSCAAPYAYHTSDLNTMAGFGKKAPLCASLNQPWVQNRGIPRNLMLIEDAIKGRDRCYQPYCQTDQEDDELQFTTFRPPPVLPRGIPPSAPVPIIEVRGYGGGQGGCDHLASGRGQCGKECRCGDRCQCKGSWRGMGATTKPLFAPAGMAVAPACKISF